MQKANSKFPWERKRHEALDYLEYRDAVHSFCPDLPGRTLYQKLYQLWYHSVGFREAWKCTGNHTQSHYHKVMFSRTYRNGVDKSVAIAIIRAWWKLTNPHDQNMQVLDYEYGAAIRSKSTQAFMQKYCQAQLNKAMAKTSFKIEEALANGEMSAEHLATQIGVKSNTVRQQLSRMAREGSVVKTKRGVYALSDVRDQTSVEATATRSTIEVVEQFEEEQVEQPLFVAIETDESPTTPDSTDFVEWTYEDTLVFGVLSRRVDQPIQTDAEYFQWKRVHNFEWMMLARQRMDEVDQLVSMDPDLSAGSC